MANYNQNLLRLPRHVLPCNVELQRCSSCLAQRQCVACRQQRTSRANRWTSQGCMSICDIFCPTLTDFVIYCFVLTGKGRVASDLSRRSRRRAPATCTCIHLGETQRSPSLRATHTRIPPQPELRSSVMPASSAETPHVIMMVYRQSPATLEPCGRKWSE